MRVFVLAAGFGKRLRPFTEKLPKPLIKVKNKPLIHWNLKKIKKAGFKTIYVNEIDKNFTKIITTRR